MPENEQQTVVVVNNTNRNYNDGCGCGGCLTLIAIPMVLGFIAEACQF